MAVTNAKHQWLCVNSPDKIISRVGIEVAKYIPARYIGRDDPPFHAIVIIKTGAGIGLINEQPGRGVSRTVGKGYPWNQYPFISGSDIELRTAVRGNGADANRLRPRRIRAGKKQNNNEDETR